VSRLRLSTLVPMAALVAASACTGEGAKIKPAKIDIDASWRIFLIFIGKHSR